MPVFDTDILVAALRGYKEAEDTILSVKENERFITTISVIEIFQGAMMHQKKEEKIEDAFYLLSNLYIYELDFSSSMIAANIFARNRISGNIIDAFDVLIASICLSKDERIITRNISDFSRIKGLKIEKW